MPYFILAFWLWAMQPGPPVEPLAPLQIAEQFVAPTGWEPMKSYLCCEAAGQAKDETLGQQIPAKLQRRCQLLEQGAATAVVAVELRDSVERKDFYLHFRKEADTWKLRAIRNLAMTHLGPPMLGILTAMPPDEVAQYNQKHPEADHAFTVGNLQLWTAADADIAAHFARNRADFQKVLRLVQAGRYFEPTAATAVTREEAANADPAVHALLRKLFLGRVARRETGCTTCVEFVIGGKVNSTVGLLFQGKGTPPPMDPEHLIVLRPLGGGWFLYKTA